MVVNGYRVARFGLVIGMIVAISAGCSARSFPLLYRQPIFQGNRVTVERFEQVRLGMSREQVEFILGSPSYVDPFHPERWDYYFILDTGKKEIHRHQMVFFFEEDALVKIEGEPTHGERISEFLSPK
jgi:outer membrane protein assembly factor BamE